MSRREQIASAAVTFAAQEFASSKAEKASKVEALFSKCNRCLQPLGGDTVQDLRKHRESCPKTGMVESL